MPYIPTTQVASSGQWATYAAALTATITNPTLGDGSIAGYYYVDGKFVHVQVHILFGTGSTAGSGTYRVNIPINFDAGIEANRLLGTAYGIDSSAGNLGSVMVVRREGTAQTVLMRAHAATVSVSNTSPWTWADGDALQLAFIYQSV